MCKKKYVYKFYKNYYYYYIVLTHTHNIQIACNVCYKIKEKKRKHGTFKLMVFYLIQSVKRLNYIPKQIYF